MFARTLSLIALTMLVSLTGPAAQEARQRSPVVVELFTSQGCSSCPPADRLLGELARRDDVIALSFNVDYWDYLGWPDTLADPHNSQRQQAYSSALGGRVYTPQMVIDGRGHYVGSDRDAVAKAIKSSSTPTNSGSGSALDVSLKLEGDKILLRISGGNPRQGPATIWLMRFDKSHVISIRRGENSGQKLTYTNVVRGHNSLGLWRGKDMEIALMREELTDGGRDGCAVIIQQNRFGPILGAAFLVLPK